MDEVFDKMETGEAAISAYYAGDYLTMLETNPDLKYVVPEEGSNWFVDAMCVLKDAGRTRTRLRSGSTSSVPRTPPLKNMDYIWYASPNKEALADTLSTTRRPTARSWTPELYEIMAAPRKS